MNPKKGKFNQPSLGRQRQKNTKLHPQVCKKVEIIQTFFAWSQNISSHLNIKGLWNVLSRNVSEQYFTLVAFDNSWKTKVGPKSKLLIINVLQYKDGESFLRLTCKALHYNQSVKTNDDYKIKFPKMYREHHFIDDSTLL